MKLMQPVLLQSFEDEFDLDSHKDLWNTPAVPHSMLIEGDTLLGEDEHLNYRKGVGKLIHLSKYSRPDIANAIRELSKYGSKPTAADYKAMIWCMNLKQRDYGCSQISSGMVTENSSLRLLEKVTLISPNIL